MNDCGGVNRLVVRRHSYEPGALAAVDVARGGSLASWAPTRPPPVAGASRATTRNDAALPRRPRARRRSGGPRPLASRQVILFLAANPSGMTRLALDEECAAIERELRMAPGRDEFEFQSKWAVSVDEMMRYLNESRPTIIHFSGHGSSVDSPDLQLQHPPWPHRDIGLARGTGIFLQDHRKLQHVTGSALTKMIASAAPSARVVVLNACFSDAVAESLRDEVDCVVSMSGAVDDDAARSFAVSFYRALGNSRSVGNAVAQAVATLAAKQLPDEHLPVCRTRSGVHADEVFLWGSSLRRP